MTEKHCFSLGVEDTQIMAFRGDQGTEACYASIVGTISTCHGTTELPGVAGLADPGKAFLKLR